MVFTVVTLLVLFLVATPSNGNKCEGKRDIVFLLDMSGSVGERNFQTMLDFVSKITSQFYIGKYSTLVGVDVFSTGVKTSIKLNDNTNSYDLLNAIKRVQYEGGWTNTYLGLENMMRNSFSYSYGHRYGVPKIGIVLTDGQSQDNSRTVSAAQNVKNSGIKLFAVGIGDNINRAELKAIASSERKRASIIPNRYLMTVSSFKKLDVNTDSGKRLMFNISEMACDLGTLIKKHGH